MPAVTILTTCFDAEETIERCIKSSLAQTYGDFQHLIIDDGSTDNTVKIISNIQDSRINLIKSNHIGRAKALNLGLSYSIGEYIAILDADDMSFPTRLEKQLDVLKEEDVTLVASNAKLFDADLNNLGSTNFKSDHEHLKSQVLNLTPFCHSSVLFKKKDILNFGGYNERCSKSIDLNMYIDVLLNEGKLFCIEEDLISLNVSSDTWGVSDSESLQYFFGFMGLVSYEVFKNNGFNLMRADEETFQIFTTLYREWFYESRIFKESSSKKQLRKVKESMRRRKFILGIKYLLLCILIDPLFWTHRGVKVDYLDVKNFISFCEKESSILREIIKFKA